MTDLATDDDAFRAAQDAVRKAERERDRRRQQAQANAAQVHENALRAQLAERYPSTVADGVFDLAERVAYNDPYNGISDRDRAEAYAEIVALIDKAIKNRDLPCPSCEEIITGSQPVCPYCGYVVVSS